MVVLSRHLVKNAKHLKSTYDSISYAPFSNHKQIFYSTLKTSGTTKDCYLTLSAFLVLGKQGRVGTLVVSQDGNNRFAICKCMATDFYDNVNGYASLPFMGFVMKGTRFKYLNNGSDVNDNNVNAFVAYEFS